MLTLSQEAGLERISWSIDGQLFSVCTRGGSLNVYVSHVPLLTSVCAPRVAILSSLTEISLFNYTAEKVKQMTVLCEAYERKFKSKCGNCDGTNVKK